MIGKYPDSPLFFMILFWICTDAGYSTDGISWTRATDSAPFGPRSAFSATVINNRMWVIGGTHPYDGMKSDVWSSADGAHWTEVTNSALFTPRVYHQTVAAGNKMWLIGGIDENGYRNDVWTSTDGATWTEDTPDAGFTPREGFAAVSFNDKLWVIGGLGWVTTSGLRYFNDVWYREVPVEPEGYTYSMTNTFSEYAGKGNCVNMSSILDNLGWKQVLYKSYSEVTKADFGVNPAPNQKTLNDATLHYHVGHGLVPYGVGGNLSGLGLQDQPNNSLSPSDVENMWGNGNKWVILHSCYALKDERWSKALSTSHGVLGFKTMVNINAEFTQRFFDYAIDEKKTIYSAYRLTTYVLYKNDPVPTKTIPGTGDPDYNSTPEIPVAAVVFNNIDQAFNDYLPGIETGFISDTPGKTFYRDEWRCNEAPR